MFSIPPTLITYLIRLKVETHRKQKTVYYPAPALFQSTYPSIDDDDAFLLIHHPCTKSDHRLHWCSSSSSSACLLLTLIDIREIAPRQ